MINLMYLVLTALLALNVSAEIINAFFALNKGIKDSTTIVDKANSQVIAQINKQADAYKNPINESYRSASQKVQEISKSFIDYISGINSNLITEAGGPNPKYADGRPVKYKDKDVTTRMFLAGGKGDEIKARIEKTRADFLATIPDPKDKVEVEKAIALMVDQIAPDSKAKNWSEYKFKQMPVAAVMPFLTKLQSDAKTSETALLNYYFNKIGGTDIKVDKFLVVIAPKNGYVISGEKFEAEVALAAYSSSPGSGVTINVNGGNLAVKDGKAQYSTTTSETGKKKVVARASIKNPLTGVVESATSEFEYEVGRRSVTVSADKMNVFYIGVDNPISVAAAGVSSNALQVNATGITLNPQGGGKYITKPTAPGEATITVSGGGLQASSFKFRVKRIPDPVAKLGKKSGGTMGNGEFKAYDGLFAMLEGFDFDAKCAIQGYKFTRVEKRQDPVTVTNSGGNYGGDARRIANLAKPGDIFYFDEVKARCPGDIAGREINSLVITIK
jgi:gliding motility-associated protein GldM